MVSSFFKIFYTRLDFDWFWTKQLAIPFSSNQVNHYFKADPLNDASRKMSHEKVSSVRRRHFSFFLGGRRRSDQSQRRGRGRGRGKRRSGGGGGDVGVGVGFGVGVGVSETAADGVGRAAPDVGPLRRVGERSEFAGITLCLQNSLYHR